MGTRSQLCGRTVAVLLVLSATIAGCGDSSSPTPEVPTGPVGGAERPVDVFVPSSYDGSSAMPLVLLLHSYSIPGSFAVGAFGFKAVAEERGFLLAVPEGLRDRTGSPYWNATSGCCDFDESGVGDSAYLRRVIEDVQARWKVDRKRIFTIGVSNVRARRARSGRAQS